MIRSLVRHPHFRKTLWLLGLTTALALFLFWRCLPDPLFRKPYATVVEDRDGRLLGARIAGDQQWRFPRAQVVPEKFAAALITFEDKRFYAHPGVDPLAVARAVRLNLGRGRVVSGASTLTMQVIRLARDGQPRRLSEKLIEAIWATRLELAVDKAEILGLYAAHAPFGGNVVGLEAAAWRYFKRAPAQLSWAESATLAVLPNNPALIHPGRNRDALLAKRNRLLTRLHERGLFDTVTLSLAKSEPLPEKPYPLPRLAEHLVDGYHGRLPNGGRVATTLQTPLQRNAQAVINRFQKKLEENGVYNAAALILDNRDKSVQAYIGNSTTPLRPRERGNHGRAVDVVPAPRSTGSTLKPFLYAEALDAGLILPWSLVRDVPSHFGSYQPENFDSEYSGAVPADRALARSLNIPAVRLQNQLTSLRFHETLRAVGMTHLTKPPQHYGLTLSLGGAESSLWELAGMYAGIAWTLNQEVRRPSQKAAWRAPHLQRDASSPAETGTSEQAALSRAALWQVTEALTQVDRPESHGLWRYFSSARKVAWKTGTSFGFRDAWSIGYTPRYTVAVWVGNADGEGRPGLTGVSTAAPIMFELFHLLPRENTWFAKPHDAMVSIAVCNTSGYRAATVCPTTTRRDVARGGLRVPSCRYHHRIHLDPTGRYRADSACFSPSDLKQETRFVLPPVEAFYYQQEHSDYRPLPPLHPDCAEAGTGGANMALVYPRKQTRIQIPIRLDGTRGTAVLKAVHRRPETRIFWHLNERYLGVTSSFHQMPVQPEQGRHRLVLLDEHGERLEQEFTVAR
ncbi:penicillin-binding protein 1C [Acanthopleuribacter pedis]|uniref:peptidoglycan glycosyltransferase n=1 Tax=Acanthopleuribacter pedis TaxID=442870 RepID=A0A8J7U3Z9_9BACT|nr:penicillin-binding protein 1C [Acanthopleuribacter pedis]MBO1320973.1 penicillin-binding protein 1C [Acanthopleuribacter pedis]